MEPFSVAYYALVRAGGVDASDTAAVLGGGPIGPAVAAASTAMGERTVVVEPSDDRRAAALRLGVAHAVDPADVERVLPDLTNGRGADVVVEATGRPAVMANALELVALQGRVAHIGIDVGQQASAELGLIPRGRAPSGAQCHQGAHRVRRRTMTPDGHAGR